MKSNIVTRIIFDEDNNKVYLSVEGKTEKATAEEKINLRNNLVKAFSTVLGIEGDNGTIEVGAFTIESGDNKTVVLNDFEAADESDVPDFVKDINKEEDKKQVLEETSLNEEQSGNSEIYDPVIGFGKEAMHTAKEVIERRGTENGIKYLNDFIVPSLKKRLSKNEPLAKERLDSIERAIRDAQSSKENNTKENESEFDQRISEIIESSKVAGDTELMAIKELCLAFGSNYEELLNSKDEHLLNRIYPEFKIVLDELKVKK